MKNLLIIMTIIFILSSSCSVMESEPEFESYFPLKTGNTWYYNRVNYNHNPYMKREIESKIVLNKKTYYVTKNIMHYSEPTSYFRSDTLRTDDLGRIWQRIRNEDFLIFDFSLEDDASYNFSGYSEDPEDEYIIIVSKIDTIEVNGEKYDDCYEFFFNIPGWVDDEKFYTFCRGIGLIKESAGEGPTLVLDLYTF